MDDRENALARRRIVVAMLHAAERPDELLHVCTTVDGDTSTANAAIRRAFDLDEVQADAVLSMQVRRFTPLAVLQMHAELSAIDATPSD